MCDCIEKLEKMRAFYKKQALQAYAKFKLLGGYRTDKKGYNSKTRMPVIADEYWAIADGYSEAIDTLKRPENCAPLQNKAERRAGA